MDSAGTYLQRRTSLLEIVAHLFDLLYRHLFDISRVLTAAVVAVPAATSQVVVAYLVELLTLTIVAWFAWCDFSFLALRMECDSLSHRIVGRCHRGGSCCAGLLDTADAKSMLQQMRCVRKKEQIARHHRVSHTQKVSQTMR